MSVQSGASPRPRLPFAAAFLRYGLAVLCVGAAALGMKGLGAVGVVNTGPLLLVAVAVGTLYGGWGPGVMSLGLAALVSHDFGVLAAGALLILVGGLFRGRLSGPGRSSETEPVSAAAEATVPNSAGGGRQRYSANGGHASSDPPIEVTTEATWRFHHEQPLDITLPEDEQVEHLYLYSVLAECNDAFARMYGFRAASDVVGTRLVVFLPPSDPENVAYLRSFIRSGYRLEDAESHEIDRYGRSKHFVNNLVGIFERGQLVGAWGTQRDVTEERHRAGTQEYSSRLHSTKSSSQ